jgi:hypothetical protein
MSPQRTRGQLFYETVKDSKGLGSFSKGTLDFGFHRMIGFGFFWTDIGLWFTRVRSGSLDRWIFRIRITRIWFSVFRIFGFLDAWFSIGFGFCSFVLLHKYHMLLRFF